MVSHGSSGERVLGRVRGRNRGTKYETPGLVGHGRERNGRIIHGGDVTQARRITPVKRESIIHRGIERLLGFGCSIVMWSFFLSSRVCLLFRLARILTRISGLSMTR